MAIIVRPDTFHPSLKFRYKAQIVGQAPGLEFYGRSVDLPKWTQVDGWKNPLKIRCYQFERITVKELSQINPDNVKLIIKIIDPAGDVIYEWRLEGDITSIDYGNLDWAIDDISEATITFEPRECILALELNKQENE